MRVSARAGLNADWSVSPTRATCARAELRKPSQSPSSQPVPVEPSLQHAARSRRATRSTRSSRSSCSEHSKQALRRIAQASTGGPIDLSSSLTATTDSILPIFSNGAVYHVLSRPGRRARGGGQRHVQCWRGRRDDLQAVRRGHAASPRAEARQGDHELGRCARGAARARAQQRYARARARVNDLVKLCLGTGVPGRKA